ncbi:WG repeat-containing protein, partial [Caldisericum sp.]|uniref:WG repeat-containing protein n=1 Tax=Caldisericum sp. TaxID=2499687 RepID=UPI003D096402
MFCPNCGRQIPDGSKFCPYCGASLEGKYVESKPKRKSTTIIIPLILILVLLFGLFALIKFIKPNTTSNTEQETIATLIPYRKGDKWGFCDRNKKLVIPAVYDGADPFSQGLARVEVNGKW